jgi:StAR-related lipid transfer protein 9
MWCGTVQSMKQCMRLLEEGDANRVTASTKLNATSSRSHAALLVHVTRREESNNHCTCASEPMLIDLAYVCRKTSTCRSA